jgi:hypothetical protein
MKTIQYLSPSSISKFYKEPREFYLNYLSENRPERFPQTKPMSIGSAFDAYVKSYLHEALFGKGNPEYELSSLFEKQVEAHNRDWAWDAGKYAFDCYKLSGALADLMTLLSTATNDPRFEFEIRGTVGGVEVMVVDDTNNQTPCVEKAIPEEPMSNVTIDESTGECYTAPGPLVLLGKPDVHFKNKEGFDVILDWKVNGFCGNSNTSPKPGYLKLRDGWLGVQSKSHNKGHKDAFPMYHNGALININKKLEEVDQDWANQLSIYGWLLGLPVGSDFIVAIDQLACGPDPSGYPKIRIAEHRTTVSKKHQEELLAKAQHVWEVVHSDHIFRDVDKELSIKQCVSLDGVAAALIGEGTDEDKWFAAATRQLRSF